jgi:hypothetical protein
MRRGCLAILLTMGLGSVSHESVQAQANPTEPKLDWYDIKSFDLEGKGWSETKAPFDRLPPKAEGVVRKPVWDLSRHSAGMCARFVTDAPSIHARWTLTGTNLAMPHMPATGVSGLDLYVRDKDGSWQWLSVGRPTAQTNSGELVGGLAQGKKEFLLYLPLYNGVSSVEVGVPMGHECVKAPARPTERRKPIVFYGTSITQGGCASRPGMVHTAILGRKLDHAVMNFGFSGNGKMEPEVGALLAEIDAAVYVIDCLPNMTGDEVAERTEPLVRILLKAHPHTPILLVEDRTYSNAAFLAMQRVRHEGSRTALRKAYEKLVAEKAGKIHYLPGDKLLGDDTEGTVDSSHPTDLGFMRQADAFMPALRASIKP